MGSSSESRAVVIGARGYVGGHLVQELRRRGWRVTGVVRRDFEPEGDVPLVSAETARQAGPVALLVNAAHPRSGPSPGWPAQNRRLFDAVTALAGPQTRVVHLSTLAVFGDHLEHAQAAERVPPRRASPYVECKLWMQDALLKARPGRDLTILRLGNVWGPGSPVWTARVLAGLREGRPVLPAGPERPSNVTDVANVADYVCHLAEAPVSSPATFHHLAEHGAVSWTFWAESIARVLEVTPVAAEPVVPRASPLARALRLPFVGAAAHGVSRMVPASLKRHLRGGTGASRDRALLHVMACPRQFETRVDPDWTPPLDVEASVAVVDRWIESRAEAGPGSE